MLLVHPDIFQNNQIWVGKCDMFQGCSLESFFNYDYAAWCHYTKMMIYLGHNHTKAGMRIKFWPKKPDPWVCTSNEGRYV